MVRVPKVPSAKKQAEDARCLAKLLRRMERNRKAREATGSKKAPDDLGALFDVGKT